MILDYSTARPSISQLKQANVTAVGRYIGWDSVPGFSSIGKNLTPAEAHRYISNGIDIFLAFEYGARAPTQGAAQGTKDGNLASKQLHDLGAPPNMGVYFAVDFDIPDYAPNLPDDPANARSKLGPVAHYFEAIHATGPKYDVDGYGGYYAIKRLLDARLIKQGWQTIAWSGGQWDNRAVLRQLTRIPPLPFTDVNIRENGSTIHDYGQWPQPQPTVYWGEWLTNGHSSLHEVSLAVGRGEAQILADTVRHYGYLNSVIRAYVNSVVSGRIPSTTKIPPGGRLWVLK